ncbi:uncharacterized protein TRIADDRAFT_61654 [Trichoplax adhaerens]|uniref:Bromo domain-containing protein n=1 Tax=Trichoplax adhaerens TaxID=10228 RepID=B3SBL1_TRIAD|nr:predicted protein [Trichoplax adhaerens]EDV19877.1 predicted protein [Trichoplax adhaerens]|eukprot:XP_002117619.1 predicted protein [Trichoplax adhaerens]
MACDNVAGFNNDIYMQGKEDVNRISLFLYTDSDDEFSTYLLDILTVSQLTPLERINILHKLCDWSIDSFDETVRAIDADATRLEPVGVDRHGNKYWYFFGTRLYKEAVNNSSNNRKRSSKANNKIKKKGRGRPTKNNNNQEIQNGMVNNKESTLWSVVCATAAEWSKLAKSFRQSTDKNEKYLYATLSTDFVPEIPSMIIHREKAAHKKLMLELMPRRTSNRIASKVARRNEGEDSEEDEDEDESKKAEELAQIRMEREKERRQKEREEQKAAKARRDKERQDRAERVKLRHERIMWQQSGLGSLPEYLQSKNDGKTYNESEEESVEDEYEDLYIGMHKIIEVFKKHEDSWPFMEPVTEDIAPGYFEVIEQPMDIETIEKKLEKRTYKKSEEFISDMRLIFANCIEYNGEDNCYTEMAHKLEAMFNKSVQKHLLDDDKTSDEEYKIESEVSSESSEIEEDENENDSAPKRARGNIPHPPISNGGTFTGVQNNWNGHPNNVVMSNVAPYPYPNYVHHPQYAPFIHTGQSPINQNSVHGHPFPHYYPTGQPVVDNHMHKSIGNNNQQPNYTNIPAWNNPMMVNHGESSATSGMRQMQGNNKGRLQQLLEFGTQQAQLLSQPRHVFPSTPQQQAHTLTPPYNNHLPHSSPHLPSASMIQQPHQQFFPSKMSQLPNNHANLTNTGGDLTVNSKASQDVSNTSNSNQPNRLSAGNREVAQNAARLNLPMPYTGTGGVDHASNIAQQSNSYNPMKGHVPTNEYANSVSNQSKQGSVINASSYPASTDSGNSNSLNIERGSSVEPVIQSANGHLSPNEYFPNYGNAQQYNQGTLSKQFYPDLNWQPSYNTSKEPYDGTGPMTHSQPVMQHHYPAYFQHQSVDGAHNLKQQQQYHNPQFYNPGFTSAINPNTSEFTNAMPLLKNGEISNQAKDEECS